MASTEAWGLQAPHPPSKMPRLPPSRLWTPIRRFTGYKGLALSWAICGFAAHVGLLLGLEEGFVCREGQQWGPAPPAV